MGVGSPQEDVAGTAATVTCINDPHPFHLCQIGMVTIAGLVTSNHCDVSSCGGIGRQYMYRLFLGVEL